MPALIAKCGVLVRRHEGNLKETMLSVVAYTWKHSQKGADPRTQEPTCQVHLVRETEIELMSRQTWQRSLGEGHPKLFSGLHTHTCTHVHEHCTLALTPQHTPIHQILYLSSCPSLACSLPYWSPGLGWYHQLLAFSKSTIFCHNYILFTFRILLQAPGVPFPTARKEGPTSETGDLNDPPLLPDNTFPQPYRVPSNLF